MCIYCYRLGMIRLCTNLQRYLVNLILVRYEGFCLFVFCFFGGGRRQCGWDGVGCCCFAGGGGGGGSGGCFSLKRLTKQ